MGLPSSAALHSLPTAAPSAFLTPSRRGRACPWPARRYALPQQAALTIILLLYSRPLCANNAAIQHAYAALGASLARRSRLLGRLATALESYGQLSRYYETGRSCAAAVLAAPLQAREAVRAACLATAVPPAAQDAASDAAGYAARSVERCLRWQPLRCGLVGARAGQAQRSRVLAAGSLATQAFSRAVHTLHPPPCAA